MKDRLGLDAITMAGLRIMSPEAAVAALRQFTTELHSDENELRDVPQIILTKVLAHIDALEERQCI